MDEFYSNFFARQSYGNPRHALYTDYRYAYPYHRYGQIFTILFAVFFLFLCRQRCRDKACLVSPRVNECIRYHLETRRALSLHCVTFVRRALPYAECHKAVGLGCKRAKDFSPLHACPTMHFQLSIIHCQLKYPY